MIRDFERVDLGDGDSTLLWSSGALLQKHYCDPKVFNSLGLSEKRVLELGSGSGLLAIGLSKLGASVIATDIPPDLDMLQRQVARAQKASDTPLDLTAEHLLWGEDCPLVHEHFDFIFCADLVAIDEAHEALLWTLQRMIRGSTRCIFAFKDREDFSFSFMAMLHDLNMFIVKDVEGIDLSCVEDGNVMVYEIVRRAE